MKETERICEHCNKSYKTRKPVQKYCSTNCSWEKKRSERVSIKANGFVGTVVSCKICNNKFEERKAGHIYCSEECRLWAYKEERYARGTYLIFERDAFRCFYCGKVSYEDCVNLHADHIIPRKLGGADTADNLVTSCEGCNKTKQASNLNQELTIAIMDQVEKRNERSHINGKMLIKF